VIGYDLAEDGGLIKIEVFVRAPYDKFVTNDTRFWQAGGIDVSLGTEGLSVHTQSVLSMLIGGIAFETPPSTEEQKPAKEKAVFELFSSRTQALANPESIVTSWVIYPSETLRGLNVGAPVVYRGLSIGEVTDVGFEYNPETNSAKPRVDFVVYPTRLLKHTKKSPGLGVKAQSEKWRQTFIQAEVDRGLRAQLRSGSLLTGQLYVALDIFPDAPKVKIDWTKSPAELPVVPSGMQELQNKVNSILTKIDKVPVDAIGENLKNSLARLDGVLKHMDGETLPEVKTTLEELKRVLASIDATMVGKDAPTQQQLRDTLQEISKAAQGVSGLTEYLEKNPEALIRGKTQEKP
jgi:paraquat-inducible protein B